jgi:hypothetical protein
VRVQSFSSSSVKPGHDATFVVWVWTTEAASDAVTVAAKVASATDVDSPTFAICPAASGATCKLGNIPLAQADELQVKVPVGGDAAAGEHVQLTAKATAAKSTSFSGSATDVVVAASAASPTPSVPGDTLPPFSLEPEPGSGIADSGVSASNPSSLFPTVGPSSPGTSSSTVKPRKDIGIADAAAAVPLDDRLIGGQLAGLAVLAGAVAIAIARLSLRTPKAPDGKSDQPPQ